ncbi:cobalamin-5'-phosphate synthase [Cohaesibacter sp. ES.047]|uniref:adenosylcobinamide-GDP ribazoletransferase n=1 Tax=Cohaesibacter sp. ES.047 TaxID=1798205 RepID=UPI000BB7C6BC|nr:adenosylcobinamide-GDP ribazoletransferase [Cohaesibacter sp. ES.047]SNY93011.1 cobalamin-5'-phosphate synthase [Cohaesibacter sp. ES.047]
MEDKHNEDLKTATSSSGFRGLSDWWQDFIDCIAFFSRLPVPPFLGKATEGMPPMPRTCRALPLIGLLLGVVAIAPATIFDVLALTAPLPNLLLAAMTIATMVMITGGLHEDGLADVADGFWGGHTIERKLEIMKDSRLGSYGSLALMLSLLMRISILYYLFDNYGVETGGIAYLASCLVSRVPILHVWYTLPPARLNGLAASLGQPQLTSYATGIAMAAIATALMVIPLFGFLSGLSAFVMVVLSSLLIVSLAQRHIKGQTGDVLGASQQMGEIAFGIGLLLFANAG